MDDLTLDQAAKIILESWINSGKIEVNTNDGKPSINKKDLYKLLQSPSETLVSEYERLLKRHEDLCIALGKVEHQKEDLEQRYLMLPTAEQWENAMDRIQELSHENQSLKTKFETRPLTTNLVHTHVELYELKARVKQLGEENDMLKNQMGEKGKKLTDRLKFLFNEKGTP